MFVELPFGAEYIPSLSITSVQEGDQCGRSGFQQHSVETRVPPSTEQILLASLFQCEGMRWGYSCTLFPPTLLFCCPGNSILGSGRKTQQGKQHLLLFHRNSERFGHSGRRKKDALWLSCFEMAPLSCSSSIGWWCELEESISLQGVNNQTLP